MENNEVISQVARALNSDPDIQQLKLRNIHVHFYDEDGENIGYLPVSRLLDDIINAGVTQWLEAGPDCPDGTTPATLDITEASHLKVIFY